MKGWLKIAITLVGVAVFFLGVLYFISVKPELELREKAVKITAVDASVEKIEPLQKRTHKGSLRMRTYAYDVMLSYNGVYDTVCVKHAPKLGTRMKVYLWEFETDDSRLRTESGHDSIWSLLIN